MEGVENNHSGGFFSSDDISLNKQIQATHAPDMGEFNARPILAIVEDILRLGRPTARDKDALALASPADHVPVHLESSHDKMAHDKVSHPSYIDSEIVKELAYPINKISIEITSKCVHVEESHQVTIDLLRSLSSFTWDAKVVIAFAAFAINYGEFRLVKHHHTMNPLAKNIEILKHLPEIMAQSNELKKQYEAILNLLNAILEVTHCIIEFKELPPYTNAQSPEITPATAHIPTAVYWCIRALLVCAFTLLTEGHESIISTSASWEMQNLTHKLSVIFGHFQYKMRIYEEFVERNKLEDQYAKFKLLLEMTHIDNMEVLNAIFRPREDQRPLYHGSRNTNDRLDVLRLKHVLLLISDLDIPPEELYVLHLIHNEHVMRHEYEILWLPITDPHNEVHHNTFINLRNNMPWFSADHPSAIEPIVIWYIWEELQFSHIPMLFVLDLHGKLSHHDALPMMWIWGAKAFPFTREWERKLWEETEWNIGLIADSIDPRISDWINTNEVICLYGGDDVNWVRKFTQSTKTAARALNVQLEMLYVGKRNPKEKVRLCHEVIARERLSHIFATDFVWYFWVRLASMWNSRRRIGWTVEDDHIMHMIFDLLTYDSTEKGWAIFGKGLYKATMASGDKLVPVLDNYKTWGYKDDHPDEFVHVLDKNLKGYHPEHHYHRLILPGQAGYIPERKQEEDQYAKFKRLLEMGDIDNIKGLNAIFRHREDQRPIYHGSRNTNERLDTLRLKYVLLLISDPNFPPEELHALHLNHNEHTMRHNCEILWLPFADPYAAVYEVNHNEFINIRNNMPWFSAGHPSAIEPVAIRYIREELRFSHMPMLVLLDPHGKLSHHDVLPMMWIWGAKAFPFTREWEMKLWKETEWNIGLIADSIDPRISDWINTNKVICLYGGDDINWVRKFTQSVKTTARALNVQLEMLYAGKRNPKEKVRLCHEVIARENLSHIFSIDYYDFVWYFWVRLASMWNSKKRMGRTVEDDHIMQGILDLLTYDSSEQGWAVFSRGIYETTMASGDKLVPALDNYMTWGYEVDHPDKFVPVLDKNLKGYHPEHHCNRIILPGHAG